MAYLMAHPGIQGRLDKAGPAALRWGKESRMRRRTLAILYTLAGLADGVFDVEPLTAGFDTFDRNDDGLICFKSFPSNANPASLLQYFHNVVDNNASVPNG
jgi:hypothetical protein